MTGSISWKERLWRRAGLHALGFRMEEYDRYLETEHWQSFRRSALDAQLKEHGRNFCQQCSESSRSLHVHHITYERLGKELAADVSVICETCHDKLHLRDAKSRKRNYAPGFR